MENQNTPLWDASLDINERLDWLLEALNLDEKMQDVLDAYTRSDASWNPKYLSG